jgi:hypothetical protein
MFTEMLAEAIGSAGSLARCDEIGPMLWQAVAAGQIGDDEAQALAERLEAQRKRLRPSATALGVAMGRKSLFPKRRPQRRPERSELIERQRRTAFSGPMPPSLASRFTLCELAVLAVVAREIEQRGACGLCVDAIAALAGTSRRLVQSAIRLAHDTGLLLVQERRRHGNRNLPNRITMLSREWFAWIKRRGGGCKPAHPMSNQVDSKEAQRPAEAVKEAAEGQGWGCAAVPPDSGTGPSRRAGVML